MFRHSLLQTHTFYAQQRDWNTNSTPCFHSGFGYVSCQVLRNRLYVVLRMFYVLSSHGSVCFVLFVRFVLFFGLCFCFVFSCTDDDDNNADLLTCTIFVFYKCPGFSVVYKYWCTLHVCMVRGTSSTPQHWGLLASPAISVSCFASPPRNLARKWSYPSLLYESSVVCVLCILCHTYISSQNR